MAKRAVTEGNRYQVASRPQASSSAAATRPPWAKPGPAWCSSRNENVASYSVSPSLSGVGSRIPVGFSPHPQQAGSWCGGMFTLLVRDLVPLTARQDGGSWRNVGPPRRFLTGPGPGSAETAAFEVGFEEVLRARSGH